MADVLLLDENPLQDVRNTRKMWAMLFGGKLLQRTDIDRLLGDAERLAATN